MVKTTYALTLFAAVSLAAPVSELAGRSEKQGSGEHENILDGIPLIVCAYLFFNHKKGKLTPTDEQKDVLRRDVSKPEHQNVIDKLPLLKELFGNVSCPLGADISNTNAAGLTGAPK